MGKINYIILGILALSVFGNVMQGRHYHELVMQQHYIYDGAIEHLKATLKRELTAISEAKENEQKDEHNELTAPSEPQADEDGLEHGEYPYENETREGYAE
ncbi:MAG: hypothetical protein LBV36_07350 [Chromatiales bacterium]|jgi:hypothetical protein|nr:hypothetical protein [Chromatiales bacterium]